MCVSRFLRSLSRKLYLDGFPRDKISCLIFCSDLKFAIANTQRTAQGRSASLHPPGLKPGLAAD